jgi:hypothetical protein
MNFYRVKVILKRSKTSQSSYFLNKETQETYTVNLCLFVYIYD